MKDKKEPRLVTMTEEVWNKMVSNTAALNETIALLDSQLANYRMRCYNLERMIINKPNSKTIED